MHTWGWYLRRYIADVARERRDADRLLAGPAQNLARRQDCAHDRQPRRLGARRSPRPRRWRFIDLHEIIARRYDALGAAA